MSKPVVDFWFEFASTYSYPAIMRVQKQADDAGVTIRYRPFLLGPIFKAQGWDTSPFNIYEVKGRYMWRDLERLCADLSIPFRRPDPFPQNSLLAARVAVAGDGQVCGPHSGGVGSGETEAARGNRSGGGAGNFWCAEFRHGGPGIVLGQRPAGCRARLGEVAPRLMLRA